MEYTGKGKFLYDGKMVEFNYVTTPSLPQKMAVVEGIVSGVINEINGFSPLLKKYFTTVAFVSNLTDIELPPSFIESSAMIEQAKLFLLVGELFGGTYDEIVKAADEEIEYTKSRMVNKSFDDMLGLIVAILEKYGKMFDGLDVNDVVNKLNEITKMSNISEETIVKNILEYRDQEKEEVNE